MRILFNITLFGMLAYASYTLIAGAFGWQQLLLWEDTAKLLAAGYLINVGTALWMGKDEEE